MKICILRLSAIGDVCHALAVVQAIARHYPHAEISWVIGKTEANLLSGLPNIRLIPYDKKTGWKGIFTLWAQLKGEKFDVLLNMQSALRASILSLGIRATQKWGFGKKRAREMQWLFTNKQVEEPANPHVLDGLMMFAKAIGVTDLTPKWELPITPVDHAAVAQYIDKSRKNVVFAPCSSKKAKDWAPEKYAEVARFAAQHNINVLIAGSPSDYEMQTAAKIAGLAPNCVNLAGKTSLKQMVALIAQADLVIASDSAPAHFATTQGTPVIGLYVLHNPLRTGPYHDLANVVSVYDQAVLESYGKPWQQLPWATKAKSKTKGENLMDRIEVAQVIEKVVAILKVTV